MSHEICGQSNETVNRPKNMQRSSGSLGAEPDVYPIFYYNDILGLPGERIGLNLFEPRYAEMCARMKAKRIPMCFIFVPNLWYYFVLLNHGRCPPSQLLIASSRPHLG